MMIFLVCARCPVPRLLCCFLPLLARDALDHGQQTRRQDGFFKWRRLSANITLAVRHLGIHCGRVRLSSQVAQAIGDIHWKGAPRGEAVLASLFAELLYTE